MNLLGFLYIVYYIVASFHVSIERDYIVSMLVNTIPIYTSLYSIFFGHSAVIWHIWSKTALFDDWGWSPIPAFFMVTLSMTENLFFTSVSINFCHISNMSCNLNDAAMAGNVEEVLIRLNMGEDVNQKCYPRYIEDNNRYY